MAWHDCFVLLFLKGRFFLPPSALPARTKMYFRNQLCRSEQVRRVQESLESRVPSKKFKAWEWPIRQSPLLWKKQLKSLWCSDQESFFQALEDECLSALRISVKTSPWDPEKLKFKAGAQLHGCQRLKILSLCETPELGMVSKMDPEPPTRWRWADKRQGITSGLK